jgi:small-conductance mechanosensitive channel
MSSERATLWRGRTGVVVLLLLMLLGFTKHALPAEGSAAKSGSAESALQEAELQSAAVEIDGRELFRVRGNVSFPPDRRAEGIASRIRALAADPAFNANDLRAVESDIGTEILAGKQRVLVVTEPDAKLEGFPRRVAAEAYLQTIREAIESYRKSRTREALTTSAAWAAVAVVAFLIALMLVIWLWRWMLAALERRYRERIHSVGIQSFQIVRAERIWSTVRTAMITARTFLILILAFICAHVVLGLFPWTQGTARRLVDYVLGPLATLGNGLIAQIPSLLFLLILFLIARYTLKLIHLFFSAVGRGEVKLESFDPDWAEPTYKIVRVLVIVFALVVAYPYIPGSSSDAFKGISLFIGVVFSLGSSSIIANMLAGYTMTYRRAFRVGDRVKIGDVIGDVSEIRLQVTHVRTVKNEEVIVPNSKILGDEVVNYSTLARTTGLILHTRVGIGYETPWRQVEAMLLEAVRRTNGLKQDPPPFVRELALGDFCVTYELNAYCGDAQAMNALYAEVHRHILDVFNEYGVQIMTPAYEGDPPEPKVVPKDQWYAAPAQMASTK